MKKQYISPNTKVVNVALTNIIALSAGVDNSGTGEQGAKDFDDFGNLEDFNNIEDCLNSWE